MKKFKFRETVLTVIQDGRHVRLVDSVSKEPYARLSVVIPGAMVVLPEHHFWLKDWGENEQIVNYMIEHHLLKIVLRVPGYDHMKVAELTNFVNDGKVTRLDGH